MFDMQKKKTWYLLFACIHIYLRGVDVEQCRKLAEEYTNAEDFAQAIDQYQQILCECPLDEGAHFYLASIYLKIGNIDAALSHYRRVLSINPRNIAALYNIGYTYKTAGYIDEAISTYKLVLACSDTYDPAHLALGFAYLNKGDFLRGWQQHTHYLKSARKNADQLRELLATKTLAGKRIVCLYEGGIGDTFMCIRYLATLKELGAYTICFVQAAVVPILSRCPYIDELYPFGSPIPPCDASSTLLALPAVFCATDDTIPRTVPYIFPDPALVRYWQQVVADTHRLKVGICWQSDVSNDVSRLPIARRGMPLATLVALLQSADVEVYSLQRFDGVEQISELLSECTLHHYDNFDIERGSFMDTAALIMHLDVVISVDSAVAHLAGALGKPVMLLLPYAVDWRWIYGRTSSPWYPTMTIFKQQQPFNWTPVVQEVYNCLYERYGVRIKVL